MSKHMTFDEWFATNGYYHDTVSTRKELMRDAWEAGVVNHEASKQPAVVDDEELLHLASAAFSKHTPKEWDFTEDAVQAVIDAVRLYLHPQPAQEEVGEEEVKTRMHDAYAADCEYPTSWSAWDAVMNSLRAAGMKVVREVKP